MMVDELKNTPLFQALKKDKNFQKTLVKLGAMPEWGQLRFFVSQFKQQLLEEMMSCEKIEDIQRYKNQILGMERLVTLPQAVDLMKEAEQQEVLAKDEAEREANRRKYNPGAILNTVKRKLKIYE